VYEPKATIISHDEHIEYFFMIHKGEVEVVLQDRKNEETVISRLKPGEFFGDIELMRHESIVSVSRIGLPPSPHRNGSRGNRHLPSHLCHLA
jgi:CRP-like cAMP-binding protein